MEAPNVSFSLPSNPRLARFMTLVECVVRTAQHIHRVAFHPIKFTIGPPYLHRSDCTAVLGNRSERQDFAHVYHEADATQKVIEEH